MTLYLHNCTQGTLEINYRGDYAPTDRDATARERQGFKRVRMEPWGPGHINLAAGFDATDIIDQLKHAGGIATTDALPRGTTASFLFDPTKPPTLAQRDEVVRHNRGIKTEEGRQRRQNAAIGTDHKLTENLTNVGLPSDMRPPETHVEWEQTEDSEQDDRGRFEEGFYVKPPEGEPKPTVRRRGRA